MRRLSLLLALALAVPAHARRGMMTPALKGRLAELAAAEKAELKPLQAREKELVKQRNAAASVIVKANPPVKSKEEAKVLSHLISADPEVASFENQLKELREQIKSKRLEYKFQRDEAVNGPKVAK
jgi:hypothetical protein